MQDRRSLESIGRGLRVVCYAGAAAFADTLAACTVSDEWLLVLGWPEFLRRARSATCAVACERWLTPEATNRLRHARQQLSDIPFLVSTSRSFDNAKQLRWIASDDVLWADELQRQLVPAASRAIELSWSQRVLTALCRADWLSPRLRLVFTEAVVAPEALPTVRLAARHVGCHRRTLWREWRRSISPASSPHLEDCLDWLILIRARSGYARSRTWAGAAHALHADLRALQRRAKRLTGHSLGFLASQSASELTDQFLSTLPRRHRGAGDHDIVVDEPATV